MSITNKNLIWTLLTMWVLLAMFFFYVLGGVIYEPFYKVTLSLVRKISGKELHFIGKIPFWFFGDPTFGFICATIPLTFISCYLIVAERVKRAFWWTLSAYFVLLLLSYLATCYYMSFYLKASNESYKGQPLTYSFSEVNMYLILLISIAVTTAIIAPINLIRIHWQTRKRQPTILHLQKHG